MKEKHKIFQAVEPLPLWTLKRALACLFGSFRHWNYSKTKTRLNINFELHFVPRGMFWCTAFNYFWQVCKSPTMLRSLPCSSCQTFFKLLISQWNQKSLKHISVVICQVWGSIWQIFSSYIHHGRQNSMGFWRWQRWSVFLRPVLIGFRPHESTNINESYKSKMQNLPPTNHSLHGLLIICC